MKYFFIAGEASGDLHASRLMKELLKIDEHAEFMFLGGDKMSRYAGTPLVHCREMAMMGIVNVFLNIRKIANIRRIAQQAVLRFVPDRVILVDYASFNLDFAKFVKNRLPETEVDFYIAPKLWASRSWRITKIRNYVDRMFTIFPFETAYFARKGFMVDYVGNPTVDAITSYRKRILDHAAFRKAHDLDDRKIILLMAGSRTHEVRDCLPLMAEIASRYKDYQFVLAAAPNLNLDFYHKILSKCNGGDSLKILQNCTYEVMEMSHAGIINSGTATLEAALFGLPQVVVYKVFAGRLAMALKPLFIRTKFVSLVNIIPRREVVKELLGHHFSVNNTIAELNRLMNDDAYRSKMISDYQQVKDLLGPGGAPKRLAEKIFC